MKLQIGYLKNKSSGTHGPHLRRKWRCTIRQVCVLEGNLWKIKIKVVFRRKTHLAPRWHPICCTKRLLVLILMLLGSFLGVMVRSCINIAIIEMISDKEFTNQVQLPSYTLIFGTHYYGFLLSPIGGYLANKCGGSVTYGVSNMLMSILTILNPASLTIWNGYVFMACRIAAGIFDGFAYASIAEIFTRWVPAKERSTSMAIVLTGIYIGNTFAYPTLGYLTYSRGWPMIFYVTGVITLVWSVIWLIIVRNQPSEDKTISERELLYIQSQTETTPRDKVVYPILKIITSLPVWAVSLGAFVFGCGMNFILLGLPLYIRDAPKKNFDEVGLFSSIPNFVCVFTTPILGVIMDLVQNYTKLKASQVHKIMMTFGFSISCILFLVAAAFSNNFILSMTCLLLIELFLSLNYFILQLVFLYLAPKHSSILLGVIAFWHIGGKIIIPLVIAFFIGDHSMQDWRVCFLLSSGIMLFETLVYWKFGSSQLQPWATSYTHPAY